jgi:hypothetical protein
MGDARPAAGDLLALDRDVARGASELARWRAALVRDPEAHADEEPLEAVRHVAGKSTWDALGALAPSAVDAPLVDALRRWVFALTQARIGCSDDVARARGEAGPHGRFAGSEPRSVSWREAWRGVATSKTPGEARLWLDAAADAAPELASLARARAGRRVEVARRMGYEHPWAPVVPAPVDALRRLARRLLDATEELSRAVWLEDLRGETGAAAILVAAMGRDAGQGWPARLGGRWIEETLAPGGRGLRVELPSLPAVLGAASFARGLAAFGFAARASLTSGAAGKRTTPFSLAREPAFVAAHRFGFVLGALPADPQWQMRALGLGRRAALAQARVLARSALLDVRVHAARLLLGDDAAFAPSDLFDELGVRLFGAPLDARLRGAWPAARDDEPARLLGLVQSRSFGNALRDRFDVDWYRNPRAWAHLRAAAAGPAWEPADASSLEADAAAVARALEDALG